MRCRFWRCTAFQPAAQAHAAPCYCTPQVHGYEEQLQGVITKFNASLADGSFQTQLLTYQLRLVPNTVTYGNIIVPDDSSGSSTVVKIVVPIVVSGFLWPR
jgi:hypothetical protein